MREAKKFIFDVRNWLSLSAAAVFVILALRGSLSSQESMVIITLVFSFFMGRETGKNAERKAQENASKTSGDGV